MGGSFNTGFLQLVDTAVKSEIAVGLDPDVQLLFCARQQEQTEALSGLETAIAFSSDTGPESVCKEEIIFESFGRKSPSS